MNYLTAKVFHTYFSGVPNGSIIFREKKAVMCAIDRRTRVQLKESADPSARRGPRDRRDDD